MTVFLILFGFYFLFILIILYAWELEINKPLNQSTEYLPISIIIPFRDEKENLTDLIKSISALQYPKDKLQIIFVNDHSIDGSEILISSINQFNLRLISLNETSGKKAALTAGINSSDSEIIVTTDADCQFNSDWLESINSVFQNEEVDMVVGGVVIQSRTFFEKLQSLEFSSLIGSGASLLHFGIPVMANGANLAFRKRIFQDVNGYHGNEHIASGDDEYLLRKFWNRNPKGIYFNNAIQSVVFTTPSISIKQFFQQRIRWAGKWKYQTNLKAKLVAATVFCFQLSFLAAIVFYLIQPSKLLLWLLFSKATLEFVFLFRVNQFLKSRLSIFPFLVLQIIYPIYVVITAIGSMFLSFEWKGRKY